MATGAPVTRRRHDLCRPGRWQQARRAHWKRRHDAHPRQLGYDGAATTQVASALNTIKGVYLYLPLAFAVVIFVIMCFYKLNSKNYNYIVSELEQGRYHPNAKYAPHSEA